MQVSSSSYASLLDYINSQSDDTSSKGLGKAGGIKLAVTAKLRGIQSGSDKDVP